MDHRWTIERKSMKRSKKVGVQVAEEEEEVEKVKEEQN